MNDTLPKGWIKASLKDVVVSRKGKKPKNLVSEKREGYFSYILIDEMEGKPIRKYTNDENVPIADKNDVLIVWDGSIGKTATNIKGAIGSTITALTAIVIPAKFLEYFLRTAKPFIEQTSRGTGLQHINPKTFWPLSFPLPPLNEQKRIVSKLDAIIPRIEAVKQRLEKVPNILKLFRQSVLTAAVTGKLTEKWREEHPIVENAEVLLERIKEFRIKNAENKRELNAIIKHYKEGEKRLQNKRSPYSLPETWRYCEINFIGNVYNGSTPSRKIAEYWGKDEINWVSSGEVANNRINKTREQITKKGFDNSSVRLFPKGTVLIAMIGEGKTRGQTAILDVESTCNQNVAAVVINHGYILPEYLFYWFFMQYERNRSLGSGSGPKALNCQRVREINFILPPFEEQKEIVKQVEKLFAWADKVEAHYQKAKEQVDKLTQSVLAKAFRGELVPQDPNDEPAEKLLEKILKEKAKMEMDLKAMKKKVRKKL